MLVTVYKVYEVGKDYREHGRLLKTYKTKSSAIKFMRQSIYRYVKEGKVLEMIL